MKKLLKTLAATAVFASVIPTKWNKTEDGGSLEAMLWKATWTPKEIAPGSTEVNIHFGFHNPFSNKKKNEEEDLFADELIVDYTCDNTVVYSSDDAAFVCEEDSAPVEEAICDSPVQTPVAENTDVEDAQSEDPCG